MLLRSPSVVLFVSSFLAAQTAVADTVPPLAPEVAEAIAKEGIDNSQVMRLLRDLTGKVGHRLTGSDNFTKGCEWAKGEFEKMGLQVELEKWGEWKLVWNRGPWVGRITQPIQLDMYVATQAWTAGTQGRQKAPIVLEPDWNDEAAVAAVAGKWVLAKRRFQLMDPRLTSSAARVGEAKGLGLVYRAGDPNRDFPTRVRVFGDEKVAMKTMADVPTTPEIAVQADHFDRLLALLEGDKAAADAADTKPAEGEAPKADPAKAAPPVVECEFEIGNTFREGPIELNNVIATLPGTEHPDECVLVSSHLDSWHQVQGTTDNGTGSTTTMESARILAAVGAKPKRTIKFCLWGGEEQGLLGSRGYVVRHRTDMPKVSAVFNHDTGTNWAQSLGVTHKMAEQLAPVFEQVNRLLKAPDADWQGPVFELKGANSIGGGGGGSDHASFLAAGVPGLSWGLKGRSNYFQHTWHTQWDTIDVAIEEYQRHTATVIAMAALGTANLPTLLDRANITTGGGGRAQSAEILQGYFGVELDGLTFKTVKDGGRAAAMGVKNGDVLKRVGGKEVTAAREIFQFARDVEGDSVTFTFQRGAETFEGKLKKDDLPARRGGNQAPRDTVPNGPGGGR